MADLRQGGRRGLRGVLRAVNVIAKSSGGMPWEVSLIFYASTLQWLYNLVLAVWIVAVLVLRRVM